MKITQVTVGVRGAGGARPRLELDGAAREKATRAQTEARTSAVPAEAARHRFCMRQDLASRDLTLAPDEVQAVESLPGTPARAHRQGSCVPISESASSPEIEHTTGHRADAPHHSGRPGNV